MRGTPLLRPGGARAGGFTLLEMVIVLLLVSLLVGSVFGIVGGVTQLASGMNEEQEKDARLHALIHLFRRTLREVPPHALIRLRTQQSGTRYLSQLALRGAPSPLGGDTTGATVFQTEERPDGYQRLVLRSLDPAEVVAWEKGDSTVGRRIPLMENVAVLEWRFFNVLSGEWEPVWNERLDLSGMGVVGGATVPAAIIGAAGPQDASGAPIPVPGAAGRRPGLIELRLALGAEKPRRWVLWMPPARMSQPQTPALVVPATPGPQN